MTDRLTGPNVQDMTDTRPKPQLEIDSLKKELRECEAGYHKQAEDNEKLRERHEEHLNLIRRLSTDSISPDEAEELQAQIASLVAEVGTCRGHIRELLELLEGTCAKKWRARLAEIREETDE